MKPINPTEIPWFDEKLFIEGVECARRNFFSIFFSQVLALFYGSLYKPITGYIIKSGHFNNPEKALQRILRSPLAVDSWFSSDMLNGNSQGIKPYKRDRKLHSHYWKSLESKRLPSLEEIGGSAQISDLTKISQKSVQGIGST